MPSPCRDSSAGDALVAAAPATARQLAVAAWHVFPTGQAAAAMTSLLVQQSRAGELPSGSGDGIGGSFAFSPDGRLLATVSGSDGYIHLWDPETGKPAGREIPVAPGPNGGIGSITFSTRGGLIATSGADDEKADDSKSWVRVVNAATGRLITTVNGRFSCMALSPDGRLLATGDDSGHLRLWNASTGKLLSASTSKVSAVADVAFSPDGGLLASAGSDGSVKLWDTATGRLPVKPISDYVDRNGTVTSVAFSPDGRFLAAGDGQSMLIWHRVSDKPGSVPLFTLAHVDEQEAEAVAFSANSRLLASADGDGYVRLRNPLTGKLVGTPMAVSPGAGQADSVAFDPATGLLATAGTGIGVQIWDLASDLPVGAPLTVDSLDQPGVVSLSAAGGLLDHGSDGLVEPWSAAVAAGKRRPPDPPDSVVIAAQEALSRDGTLAAWLGGSNTNNAVIYGTVFPRKMRTRFAAPGTTAGYTPGDNADEVEQVLFSPDGKLLASGDLNGFITLWNTATGKQLGVRIPAATNEAGSLEGFAFSPDGKLLAAEDLSDPLTLWSTTTQRQIRSLPASTDDANSVEFSPDGKLLALVTSDGWVRLWDPASGRPAGTLVPVDPDEVGSAETVTFNPDGTLLAVGYDSGIVQLWDPGTKTPVGGPISLASAGSQDANIDSLAFSPDGALLLSDNIMNKVTPLPMWMFAHPYAALCDEVGPPAASEWAQYASGEQEPAGTCAGVPPASVLSPPSPAN